MTEGRAIEVAGPGNGSLEEQAREMLTRAGIKGVSTLTSGDLVEIANLIREARVAHTERADIDSLRAFALAVLEDWPEGAPDGFALQDLAVKHGLLVMKDPKYYIRSPLLLGTEGTPSGCIADCHVDLRDYAHCKHCGRVIS